MRARMDDPHHVHSTHELPPKCFGVFQQLDSHGNFVQMMDWIRNDLVAAF
jgi:hypothetical protein